MFCHAAHAIRGARAPTREKRIRFGHIRHAADRLSTTAGRAGAPCNDGRVADRRPKTLRDMALSLILLAVVALVLVGMYGGVSFSPGRADRGPGADRGRHGRPATGRSAGGIPGRHPGWATGGLDAEFVLLHRAAGHRRPAAGGARAGG